MFGFALIFSCSNVEKVDVLKVTTGGGGGSAECAPGLTSCDGACIYTAYSVDHCGACGNACTGASVCVEGACVSGPDDCRAEGAACPSRYYCDESNGRCLFGCTTNSDCPSGSTCDVENRMCNCEDAETALCGAACIEQEPSSCGDACEACSYPPYSTPTCDEGACAFECVEGARMCDGSCAPCPTDGVGSTTCDGGSCVVSECEDGFALCGGSCSKCPSGTAPEDQGCDGNQCVSKDCGSGQRWCGACVECPNDPNGVPQCDGSQCVTVCDPGYHECGGRCVADDDASQCGSSCETCPGSAHGDAVCMAGSCTLECDADARMCAGACSECPTDGVDGTRCSADRRVALACEPGWSLCGDRCCKPAPEGTLPSPQNSITVAVAVDPYGNPAYLVDGTGGTASEYIVWTGSTWQTHSLGSANWMNVLITPDGNHHLCLSTQGKLEYRRWDGTAWATPQRLQTSNYAANCALYEFGSTLVITAYSDDGAIVGVQTASGWDVHTLQEKTRPTPLAPTKFVQRTAEQGSYRWSSRLVATDTATGSSTDLTFPDSSLAFEFIDHDGSGGLVGVLTNGHAFRIASWSALNQLQMTTEDDGLYDTIAIEPRASGFDFLKVDNHTVMVVRSGSSSLSELYERITDGYLFSADFATAPSGTTHVIWLTSTGSLQYRRVP